SRRRHTRFSRDWSSDVCSSDLPEDIYRTDAKVKELIPHDPHRHNWLDMARERISFQGLPARICWVGLGQRHRLGLAFNEMVRRRSDERRVGQTVAYSDVRRIVT